MAVRKADSSQKNEGTRYNIAALFEGFQEIPDAEKRYPLGRLYTWLLHEVQTEFDYKCNKRAWN